MNRSINAGCCVLKLYKKGSSVLLRQYRKMTTLLKKEDVSRIVSNVDNFLFDCDGVLWDGRGPIPGSLETILKLKQMGKRVYYVTNNSSKSRQNYVKKCQNWGFPAEEDEIVCTAFMAAQYLKMKAFKGKVYLVGREDSLGKELTDVGIPYIGTGPDPTTSTELSDLLSTELDPEVNCVIVGFDPHISLHKILKAASYLRNPDCLFIATNEDPCLPTKGKITMPGTGTMVATVKVASERTPTVVGKPESGMFEVLHGLYDLDPSRCLMVGDRLETDILFAKKVGMKSLLVLSGHDTHANIARKGITPDLYVDCLGVIGEALTP